MTDHEQLAARLEGAEAGSRELSDEVLLALGWEEVPYWTSKAGTGLRDSEGKLRMREDPRPSPTESVDDGLALWATPDPLPKRKPWRAVQLWNGYLPGGVAIWIAKAVECIGGRVYERGRGQSKFRTTAICAALVRAAQQKEASDDK